MNNFYTLIYLTKHLNFKCKEAEFDFSYSPHKNVWEGYLHNGDEKLRVILSTHNNETALFADKYRAPKKSNVTTFFDTHKGEKIKNVSLADNDRFVTFWFHNDKKLLFQLFGNKPNVFLVEDGTIKESFKDPEKWEGQHEPEPRAPKPPAELNPEWKPKRVITKVDGKFPRQLIPDIIEHYELDEKPVEEIKKVTNTLTDALESRAEFRILENGHICLLPEDLLPLPTRKVFDNCNEAIRYAYYKTSRERRMTSRYQSVMPRIKKEIKKAKRTLSQLEDADKALERAEKYEQYGHILMANAHLDVDTGTESIELTNFYDDNQPVEISLKGQKSIAENAQYYYGKSSNAIKRVDEAKKRQKKIKQDLQQLKKLQDSLADLEKIYQFDDWMVDHKDELNQLGVLSQNQQKDTLPFRRAEIDGYEIWIGKNAKSNDALTTRAHKEDVWLHARGVGGSHVVIRMNNNKDMPPRKVLLKTAAVAAWNSKARGSSLAPVIITKRKYINKPKGAPAGSVRVQQEEVEMVKPLKLQS